jgi:dihydrofolate reductase
MPTPIISIIAATAKNGVIGMDNKMPWHVPQDLQYFKRVTMGKPMIMGRKTFESLPGILKGRPHIIISRTDYDTQGRENLYSAHNIEEAISIAATLNQEEIFIVGGAQIYAQSMDLAHRFYKTTLHITPEGDAFFPEYDPLQWQCIQTEMHLDAETPHQFDVFERVK